MPAVAEAAPLCREEIERRAADVLREHGLWQVPVDLIALVDRLGVDARNVTFTAERYAGAVARQGDAVTVLVKNSDPPPRKRFTLAHELGHLVLHLPGDGEFIDRDVDLFRAEVGGDGAGRQEVEANQFAAALLMPESAVRAARAAGESIARMARAFGVPEAAMGARVTQLGLE